VARLVEQARPPVPSPALCTAVVFVMGFSMPWHPRHAEGAEAMVAAVAGSGTLLRDLAFLETVDLYETGLGRRGIRFGLSAAYNPAWTLTDKAREALRRWGVGQRSCGTRIAHLPLAFYHTGECRLKDLYAWHEARHQVRTEALLGGAWLRAAVSSPGVPMLWRAPAARHRDLARRARGGRG
jgi:hypothetical protein